MTRKHSPLALILFVVFLLSSNFLSAQDNVSWLSDFTGDVVNGSSTLSYTFTKVDGNDCKLKIGEKETDKKGNVSQTDWVFYLSDLDPSALSFKPSGKVINISLNIKNGQKFVSVSEDGEFTGYTGDVPVTMSEVDKARALIDALKSHIGECKQTDRAWNSRDEAFDWLVENIKPSDNSGTTYDQTFSKGNKPYMAVMQTESTDSKGNQNKVTRTFDLSDINPNGINLEVSGKSLKIEVPVTGKNYFIMEKTGDNEVNFGRDFEIYTDDIEVARNIVNAFQYLVTNTKAERVQWAGYKEALGFVKDHLGEITSGGKIYNQTLSFDPSASGAVTLSAEVTDSKGTSSAESSIFYMADIQPPIGLNVSSHGAYLEIVTKDKNKYIKQTEGGAMDNWANSVRLYIDDIDLARNLAGAFEYGAVNSNGGDPGLNSPENVISWLTANVAELNVDGKQVKQVLKVSPAIENQFDLQVYTSDNSGTEVHEQFTIYPEDLSAGDNTIQVSGKKLSVPLSTGKLSYIKAFRDGELQNYTKSTDIYFDDVQKAKYFTEAIGFLIKNSKVEKREMKNGQEAWAFLSSHIKKVENGSTVYDQSIEKPDAANACKLKYNLNETDSKGTTVNYNWEFILTDIDPSVSAIDVSSKEIHIDLVTKNKQKLVKPYKNDEAQNFDDEVVIQTDDILEAKKILAAIRTLAADCK